ncbi:MAG: hypothetical protein ACYCXG_06745 [Acidiferrobacter sp.]
MSIQQINLYHPIFRREQKLFTFMTMLQGLAGVVVVALLVYGYDLWQTNSLADALGSAQQMQQQTKARLASAEQMFGVGHAKGEIAALTKREQVLGRLSRLLRESRRAQAGPAPVLTAISVSVVPGLWMTHFLLDRRHRRLVLQGHSERPSLVPIFLHRLVSAPTLIGYRFHRVVVTRPTVAGHYRPYVTFMATTAPAAHPAPPASRSGDAHGS